MGRHRKAEETKIKGWKFYTPTRQAHVWSTTIEDAANRFQERFGYYPDTRNAEPILMDGLKEGESNGSTSKEVL